MTEASGPSAGRLRLIRLAILAGVLIAALGALGIAWSDDVDHLGGDDGVDGWCFVLSGGVMLALLGAYPLLHMRAQRRSKPDGTSFSVLDRAMGAWFGVAVVVGGLFAALGIPSGFAGTDTLGAISVAGLVPPAIVVVIFIAIVVG